MPEMHMRQSGFTYSAFGPLIKNKTIQKFKATGDSRYIYMIELDKACFKHDMARKISKIYQEEWLLAKYYIARHSKLLVVHSMIDINVDLHHWSTNFVITNLETLLTQEPALLKKINN